MLVLRNVTLFVYNISQSSGSMLRKDHAARRINEVSVWCHNNYINGHGIHNV
jgi:hypothetical protein